ncbi:MAG: hypothetical protein ACK47M_12480 [Caldilinea sp.]
MKITINGARFLFDGELTYTEFPGAKREALGRLMNSRMVQATFADENPETVGLFTYPDGTLLDPDRQTDEFIAALPEYRRYGVIATTVNFQGGYPLYHIHLRKDQYLQNWDNTAFTPEGRLKASYAARMQRVIKGSDAARMAVIVGLFYFGQNHRLTDETAVKRAMREATEFLLEVGTGNILVEINNESNIGYVHGILQPHRVHELIHECKEISQGRLLVSTSYGGGALPSREVIDVADFILLHGNGQGPDNIPRMVQSVAAQTDKPIVFNEDSVNIANLRAAWEAGASWGYYDQGGQQKYWDGFQSPPTNWSINTPEKQAFFSTVAQLVGITVD